VITIRGNKHWLWGAVDQDGFVLDVLVQSRRNTTAAKRLMRKLLKWQGSAPRVMITPSRDIAVQCTVGQWTNWDHTEQQCRSIMPGVEHRSHKGLNNRAENSHQPTRERERVMKRSKSPGQLQRFVSIHDPVANLFQLPRHEMTSASFREMRSLAMQTWREIAQVSAA
jgi:putative transposase